jgi:hypothetical protein
VEAAVSGSAEVDFDHGVWIELPFVWGEDTWPDHRDWARELAEASWQDSGLTPGEFDVDNLALTLAMFAEKLPPGELPAHHVYLHLPDPGMMPLQVGLGVWDAEGEREAALRHLAGADDPDAVEPPIVEEFSTPHLGSGLRILRYCPLDPGTGALYAALDYAWRVEEHATDVRLFASCPDVGRLLQAIDDIDELARGIRVVPDVPDLPGEAGEDRNGNGATGKGPAAHPSESGGL